MSDIEKKLYELKVTIGFKQDNYNDSQIITVVNILEDAIRDVSALNNRINMKIKCESNGGHSFKRIFQLYDSYEECTVCGYCKY